MREVLHITTHMGGGVGKVLSGVASYAARTNAPYRHRILLLEQPQKTNFIDVCRADGVEILCAPSRKDIEAAVRAADVVQIEWWHHPLMAAFLADFPQMRMRLALWAHVSGCWYPYISPAFLHVPQRFIFTSPYSLDNPYWDETERTWARTHTSVIHSSGGFDAIRSHELHMRDDHFVVGYIGTQSYAKMNRDFVKYCAAAADIPGIEFVLVGDLTNVDQIRAEAAALGIEEKFRFVDYVRDVSAELAKMDVFGYLLSPRHFGTTENALLEAMAAGLPVIALDQCAEKYLITHNETGILIKNRDDYRRAIELLFTHPEERARLGNTARERVLRDFSVAHTVCQLHALYDKMLQEDKHQYCFCEAIGRVPHEFFLYGLPDELRTIFTVQKPTTGDELPPILREESKSSLPHFARVFPADVQLRQWRNDFCGGEP